MKKNPELMDLQEVCEYFGLSPATIRRRLRERREDRGNFPIPIFGFGRKALWRRAEIESWSECEVNFSDLGIPTASSLPKNRRSGLAVARQGLATLGLDSSTIGYNDGEVGHE